jgi:predicted metal-dependent peptidase
VAGGAVDDGGAGGAVLEPARLAAARLWAASRYPYLATALFALDVVSRPGIGTVAVDAGWRLHVDPAAIAGWTPAELGSVFVHHAGHLLRDHADRARALGVTDDDADRWLDAADAEINDDLVAEGVGLPGRPVLPHDLGHAPGQLAEQYFHPRGGLHRTRGECDRPDCGSGAHGCERSWDGTPGGLSAEQSQLLRCRVAAEICQAGREPGRVPAGLLRWAEFVLGGRVDWRRVLAAELRRSLASVSGSVDYSYRRPSRRSSAVDGVVLPSLRRPVPDVAVVVDTSGSMHDGLLAEALAEVERLLASVGVGVDRLRVLSCDTAASAAQRVTSARQVQLVGGGGTDMGAGIAAAAALRPAPQVVVVLTDGHTPWPQRPPPRTRVVVGLLDGTALPPPRWAVTVVIDDLPGRTT